MIEKSTKRHVKDIGVCVREREGGRAREGPKCIDLCQKGKGNSVLFVCLFLNMAFSTNGAGYNLISMCKETKYMPHTV
jgi:hypothetical protein